MKGVFHVIMRRYTFVKGDKMKKLLLMSLVTISLLQAQEDKLSNEELLQYSDYQLNNTLSLYAAKVYMKNFEDDSAYSVGLILNTDTKNQTDFGVGYMKSSEDIASILNPSLAKLNSDNDDGVLFFMNYKF